MFRTNKRDAMYSEKLKDIIQELPFAIPTAEEIKKLTGLYATTATDYAKLNGVAIDPFRGCSSYIAVDENGEACYIDPFNSCNVMDEARHKYCGIRLIIRENELTKDVAKAFSYMRQNNKGLETIYLGTIPMKLARKDEEDSFMDAKANYDNGNNSSQFKQTSRVFSENLGLGNLKITDPVYLFRGREFVLTSTDYLPSNLNNEFAKSRIFLEEKQALLKVQPATWIYDPRAKVYICEQVVASARNMPFKNPQLPKDFAKQFVKNM